MNFQVIGMETFSGARSDNFSEEGSLIVCCVLLSVTGAATFGSRESREPLPFPYFIYVETGVKNQNLLGLSFILFVKALPPRPLVCFVYLVFSSIRGLDAVHNLHCPKI